MPDISMCKGGSCPMANKCYRFTATPSHWQSYLSTPPVEPDGTCKFFMEIYSKSSKG
jgi:hypothetical protein